LGNIVDCFYEHETDRERLTDFLLAYRAAMDVRLYPTIWRVRLLLSSRVWQPEKDTRIWEDESGQIIGFMMLWSKQPKAAYIVLDGYSLPQLTPENLLTDMFEWGDERAKAIGVKRESSITVFAIGFSQDVFSDQIQNVFGYVPMPLDPDEHNLYYARALDEMVRIPSLPDGNAVQHLTDASKIEEYQSLYSFAQVNRLHQKELIESDEYSHFVVVDQAGEFVAYCECSICRAEWEITKTRIGWIDYVETHPEYRRKGYGRVALFSGLAQLQEWGADTAMLVTVNTNRPAVNLYNDVGFEQVNVSEPQKYEKRITFYEDQ
jgi:ribosomal protein S18 acetylase RimI-like enzyme